MNKALRLLFLLGLTTAICVSCDKEIDPLQPMPLDYSLQTIPSIGEIMPADLVAAMGPYINFGDNPPRIDTCFFADSIHLAKFIHNQDIDPLSTYTLEDDQYITNKFTYRFHDQHRGITDSYKYERAFGDIAYGLGYFMFENATVSDSIFIMGDSNKFTVFFRQTCKRRMEPDESLSNYISDYGIQRNESIIMSGKVTSEGITDFHMGMRIEGYSEASPRIGQLHFLPQIHDIFLYDYPNCLPYDPTFYQQDQPEN